MSVNQFKVSVDKFKVNVNQFKVSVDQFKVSVNQIKVSVDQFKVNVNQFTGSKVPGMSQLVKMCNMVVCSTVQSKAVTHENRKSVQL